MKIKVATKQREIKIGRDLITIAEVKGDGSLFRVMISTNIRLLMQPLISKMKRVSFLFTLIIIPTLIYGQNTPKTLFWKITKPGSKYESFLFGTFHEVNPAFFDSLTYVVNKLKQSDILLVEESISESKAPILTKQPAWTFEKWNAVLTNEQKQIFNRFAKKSEDTSYYNLNPLMLSLTTSRLYFTNFCQSDRPFTELMDHHIERVAKNYNKNVYSLDIDQRIILRDVAEKLTSQQDSLYTTYSIHAMQSMLNDDFSDCKILNDYKNLAINYQLDLDLTLHPNYSILLAQRNVRWTMIMDKLLSVNNCFIAVGFRHLMYKEGLIQQLRKLGYEVSPIPIEP